MHFFRREEILDVLGQAHFLRCPFLLLIGGNNGYIMVTANGGINQQRVAVSFTACKISFIKVTSQVASIFDDIILLLAKILFQN